MSPEHRQDLLADLTALLAQSALSERERATGQRLTHRLTAPVRVALRGPERGLVEAIGRAFASVTLSASASAEIVPGSDLDGADVAIWCTSVFDPTEREAWHAAPDDLKDHSFLVGQGVLGQHLSHLQDTADEAFIAFHAVSSERDDAAIDGLVAEVADHINDGLQAVWDGAQVFVERHRARMPASGARTVTPGQLQERSVVTRGPAHTDLPLADPDRQLHAADPGLQAAMDQLAARTAAMMQAAEADPSGVGPAVLGMCTAAADELVELVGNGTGRDDGRAGLRETLHEAADTIMLMSLENDPGAAADAVTVLVQVRKDLSVRLAA